MVPDRETGRKDGFVVPKQYKQSVMEELSSGCITHVTRRAIVQDVAAICLNYCKYPTIYKAAGCHWKQNCDHLPSASRQTRNRAYKSHFHNLCLSLK